MARFKQQNSAKHLPHSTATAKGHMSRPKQGIRSTTRPKRVNKKQAVSISNLIGNSSEMNQDMNPAEDTTAECELFIGATIGDQNDNTMYGDLTCRFPITSFKGNNLIFVAYVYGPNAILARAMKNRSDSEMIKAYEDIYEYLASRWFKPKFNVIFFIFRIWFRDGNFSILPIYKPPIVFH